jgi:sodium/potassium-transporting ATPase subunit alpha
LFLGPLEALAAMAVFFFVLGAGGWHYGDLPGTDELVYRQATTGCLVAIVLTQMVNVFVCRDPLLPAWRLPVLGNRLLLAGLVVELSLLLVIVYAPWGNRLFGTAALPADAWLYALPFALMLGLAEELRKAMRRRYWRGTPPVGSGVATR